MKTPPPPEKEPLTSSSIADAWLATEHALLARHALHTLMMRARFGNVELLRENALRVSLTIQFRSQSSHFDAYHILGNTRSTNANIVHI